MPISIRDPKAAELARKLAKKRGTTMTQAIISALEESLRHDREKVPLEDRFMTTVQDFNARNPDVRPKMKKSEIDTLWGK
jgi:antitoxin VapB